jgi:CubicO group peptidase (beta-lactamase class C family)
MEHTALPGISLAVVFYDEDRYRKGYGVRSSATDTPVQPQTVLHIAPLSKPVSRQ